MKESANSQRRVPSARQKQNKEKVMSETELLYKSVVVICATVAFVSLMPTLIDAIAKIRFQNKEIRQLRETLLHMDRSHRYLDRLVARHIRKTGNDALLESVNLFDPPLD